jgi:hypothetical protein
MEMSRALWIVLGLRSQRAAEPTADGISAGKALIRRIGTEPLSGGSHDLDGSRKDPSLSRGKRGIFENQFSLADQRAYSAWVTRKGEVGNTWYGCKRSSCLRRWPTIPRRRRLRFGILQELQPEVKIGRRRYGKGREVDSRAINEIRAADVAAGWAREILELGDLRSIAATFRRVYFNGAKI